MALTWTLQIPLTMKHRSPLSLNQLPKPTPVANEILGQQLVSFSFSANESVVVTDAPFEDISSNVQDIETNRTEIKGSEVEPSKAKPKKPVPPPIPRRIDLDWFSHEDNSADWPWYYFALGTWYQETRHSCWYGMWLRMLKTSFLFTHVRDPFCFFAFLLLLNM